MKDKVLYWIARMLSESDGSPSAKRYTAVMIFGSLATLIVVCHEVLEWLLINGTISTSTVNQNGQKIGSGITFENLQLEKQGELWLFFGCLGMILLLLGIATVANVLTALAMIKNGSQPPAPQNQP